MDKYNVMIGPDFLGKGGISSVIKQYQENNFFSALHAQYWASWQGKEHSRLTKIGTTFKVATQLLSALINKKINVIHVQSSSRGSFFRKSLFLTLGFLFGVPTIFHLHSGQFFEIYHQTRVPFLKWWIRFILNQVDAVVLLSESWRQLARPLVKNPDKIHVIGNPMGLRLPENFSRAARTENQLNLLYLGDISYAKGVFDVLPVLAALRQQGFNIRLRCAGNGYIDLFRAALKEHALEESVEYLGWINTEQKLSEFAAADAFILPSHYEGQPMVILEAMMVGVLVISTTVGGIPDTIVNEKEGLLVPPKDPIAMQAVLERVYADVHCADKLVVNAKVRVEKENSPAAVLAKLTSVYRQLNVLN